MDINRTEEAIEAAAEAGIKLQIGFNRRFDHNFKRVREHVLIGTVGDPHMVKITSRDPNPPHEDYIKVSGGMFMDMMIHDFDMARFLTGSEVRKYTRKAAYWSTLCLASTGMWIPRSSLCASRTER